MKSSIFLATNSNSYFKKKVVNKIVHELNTSKLNNLKYSKILIGIILINLIIFLFIPAELSYLQPSLLAFYFLIFLNFKKQLIYSLICLHFLSWVIEFQPLKIYYKSNDICNNVEAVSADINPSLQKGRLFQYINSRDKIKCWIKNDDSRSLKILRGDALK